MGGRCGPVTAFNRRPLFPGRWLPGGWKAVYFGVEYGQSAEAALGEGARFIFKISCTHKDRITGGNNGQRFRSFGYYGHDAGIR
jgi:hypothetical protein